ncbi:MAG: LSM domain-containing protein [Nitrososphaerales archaeon]
MSGQTKKPFTELQKAINKPVTVKLKTDIEYKGEMRSVDTFMNVILLEAEESDGKEHGTNYGKVVIRGDNVLFIRISDDIL